jgi:large subunit ribosomal protein L28
VSRFIFLFPPAFPNSTGEKTSEKTLAFLRQFWYYISRHFVYITIDLFFERGGSSMAKCEFCDKGVTFGIKVSHSHRRSNRTWKPNVKRVKAVVDGTPKHVYVCTRCLRSGKVTRAV